MKDTMFRFLAIGQEFTADGKQWIKTSDRVGEEKGVLNLGLFREYEIVQVADDLAVPCVHQE